MIKAEKKGFPRAYVAVAFGFTWLILFNGSSQQSEKVVRRRISLSDS